MYSTTAATNAKPLSTFALGGQPANFAFYSTSSFYTVNASINDATDRSNPVIRVLACDYSNTNIRCSTVVRLPAYYDGEVLYIVGALAAIDENNLAMAVILNDDWPQIQTLCLYTFPIQPTNGSLDCQDGTSAQSAGR